MAGISTLSGFNYNGGQYNFARDGYKTLQEMYDFPERYLPPMHIAVNEEDGNIWLFNSSNPIAETGKWRIFTGGSADLIDYFKKNEIQAMLENYQLKEDGKGLSSNDYTTLEKEKLASLENYDDTQVQSHMTRTEGQIADLQNLIGNTPLTTTSQSLTGALVEIKNSCDTANTSIAERVTANEDAIAIINGDSTVSGSIKKAMNTTLNDSKQFTLQKIEEMSANSAINCEEKPTFFDDGNGNVTITYIKDGVPQTTTDTSTWFYYTQDGKLMQTIFIVDSVDNSVSEQNIVSAGSVDFSDFVSKSKDVVDTYTGDEADTTKVGNIGAMQALEQKLQTNIDDKISGDAILDSVESSSITSALSANQGKLLNEKINAKLDKTFVGEEGVDVANKHLVTDSLGNITIADYDEELNLTSTSAPQTKVVKAEIDKKFDATQDVANVNKVLSVKEDGSIGFTDPIELGGTADKVAYENDSYFTDVTNLKQAIDKMCAKLYYEALTITSFTCNVADTHEIGTVLDADSISFNWSYNKEVKSQALTDCTIAIDDRSATYPSTLSNTKTIVLTASDGSGNNGGIATVSKKISFLPKVYYGCTNAEEINNEVVLGLSNSVLTSSVKRDYAFSCGSGEYAYIISPTSFSFNGNVWVNGFQAEMQKTSVISLTNESGYTQSYDVWRFTNSSLGAFTATIK